MNFDVNLLLTGEYHDWLVFGLVTSIKLTVVSFVFALPLSLAVAILRLSPIRFLKTLGFVYVEFIRNIPLVAHLLFWYFAAPNALSQSFSEKLYTYNFEFIAASIALTLYISAYMAEDIRSGIRAISHVQFEASRALGLSYLQTFRYVILPQALKVTIAPLVSQTLNLWKDSSIATVIGLGELMYQAARVESASFKSTEAFVFATVCYLGVSLMITSIGSFFQKKEKVLIL